jgi:hypothetical protein
MEHVRGELLRRLAVQRLALLDAEAVLLVDDDDRQPVERHGGLDQRVRADQQLELPGGELTEQVGAPARARRAGQQRGLQQLPGHQGLERREVLLGQRLGGCHERRLRPVLHRPQHRVERHDGLAGADLAHQQPLHRLASGQVAVDRRHRGPLVVRRRERERLREPALGQRPGRVERLGARALAALRAAAQERELEHEQLLERKPQAAALLPAEVRVVQRGGPVRPAPRRPQP